MSAPRQDWMLLHIPCARCWSILSLGYGKLERLFPANCPSWDAGSESRKYREYWVITSTVEPRITTHSHSLSLRLTGFGFIPSNTIFCPYVTLPGVPCLPLWKGINNYPYFLPGNTDREWGEMDSSQGSASSRARGPGPINIKCLISVYIFQAKCKHGSAPASASCDGGGDVIQEQFPLLSKGHLQ